MKIWIKLNFIISLITLICAGIIFTYFYAVSSRALQNQIMLTLEAEISGLMQNIDSFLFMCKADILIIAGSGKFKSGELDVKTITQELIQHRNEFRCYSALSFYDLKGIRLADTTGLLIRENESGRLFFKRALENGLSAAEETGISLSEKIPVVYFGALAKGMDGKPAGVVVSRVPLNKFYYIIAGSGIAKIKGVHVDIINREGRLLFSSLKEHNFMEYPEWIYGNTVQKEMEKGRREGFIGEYSGSISGKTGRYFYAFASEPGYLDFRGNGWAGLIWVPADEVYGPIYKIRNRMVLVFSFSLIITWVFVFFVSRRISRPLARFSKTAEEVGKGNLDLEITYRSKDEIGHMAGAFNSMIKQLRLSKNKMEGYAKNLEEKVSEKTESLEKTMRELEDEKDAAMSLLEDVTKAKEQFEGALAELKKTQAQLIQAGKLSGVGQLAAGIAHEINNPLTSILGFAQLMMGVKDIDPLIKDDLQRVEQEAKRCVGIIENLFNFARPQKTERIKCSLNTAVESVIKVVSYSIEREKINIKKDYENNLPDITADPYQLQQVFMNIIVNAAHAMPNGGILTVTTRARRIGDESFAEISFADTGIGIPEKNKAKIFDPFFTTSYGKGLKGSGLGLSISYAIIKEHGGRIEVESKEGGGSTFRVILPV